MTKTPSACTLGTRLRNTGIALALVLLLFSTVAVASMETQVGRVREVNAIARGLADGDSVQGLICYLESEGPSLDDKRVAVWILGERGDNRALPILRRLRTGDPCNCQDHVCQETLQIAIEKLTGAMPSPPWPWRCYLEARLPGVLTD